MLAIACSQDELATSRGVHEREEPRAGGVQAALQPTLVPAPPEPSTRARRAAAMTDTAGGATTGASTVEDARDATDTDADAGADDEGRDPRAVPEGTPPHIARVFRRLPVSVRDGPPLGGIGASGVHIDKIWLGDRYSKKRGCTGTADEFSISARRHVNVCFRVVHSRVEEDVTVVWEKDGDRVKRRRGVTIPGLHAYRSRSFLVLRSEYAARWTVRVFSADGVELAATSFTVVE